MLANLAEVGHGKGEVLRRPLDQRASNLIGVMVVRLAERYVGLVEEVAHLRGVAVRAGVRAGVRVP